MPRSDVWEETHLLPMRVKFQREADGTVVMQLPAYQLRDVTVCGRDMGDAIAKMDDAMYAIMGTPSNASFSGATPIGGASAASDS